MYLNCQLNQTTACNWTEAGIEVGRKNNTTTTYEDYLNIDGRYVDDHRTHDSAISVYGVWVAHNVCLYAQLIDY